MGSLCNLSIYNRLVFVGILICLPSVIHAGVNVPPSPGSGGIRIGGGATSFNTGLSFGDTWDTELSFQWWGLSSDSSSLSYGLADLEVTPFIGPLMPSQVASIENAKQGLDKSFGVLMSDSQKYMVARSLTGAANVHTVAESSLVNFVSLASHTRNVHGEAAAQAFIGGIKDIQFQNLSDRLDQSGLDFTKLNSSEALKLDNIRALDAQLMTVTLDDTTFDK
ncbi:MAG: hypothetical protein AAF203_09310, partial [Pseudomonadota bacterium]